MSPGARKERRGGGSPKLISSKWRPNTWLSSKRLILTKVEIIGTSGSYSIKGTLGVISLCGPEEQISCGGYFRVYQNTYN
jgi:hypothetical protein